MVIQSKKKQRQGMTLIEISLVIGVILLLAAIGIFGIGGYVEYSHGKKISANLRSVYFLQQEILNAFGNNSVSELGVSSAEEVVAVYLFPDFPVDQAVQQLQQKYKYDYKGDTYIIHIPNLNSIPVYRNGTSPLIDTSGSFTDGVFDVGEVNSAHN